MAGDEDSVGDIAGMVVNKSLKLGKDALRGVQAGAAAVTKATTGGSTHEANQRRNDDRDADGVADGHDSTGVTDVANELATLLVKFTTQIVGQVAKELVNAAGEAGNVVLKHPAASALAEPFKSAAKATAAPQSPVLTLPDASPGQVTSIPLDVRNDGLDTFDNVRLRCRALLGPGEVRIAGSSISFSPVSVDVAPNSIVTVMCKVDVPTDAKRAHYLGSIDAIDITGVQLLVQLDVV